MFEIIAGICVLAYVFHQKGKHKRDTERIARHKMRREAVNWCLGKTST